MRPKELFWQKEVLAAARGFFRSHYGSACRKAYGRKVDFRPKEQSFTERIPFTAIPQGGIFAVTFRPQLTAVITAERPAVRLTVVLYFAVPELQDVVA